MSNRSGSTISCDACLFVVLALTCFRINQRNAHKIRPVIIDAQFAKDGTYQLTIKTNIEALVARIGPEHGDTK